MFPSLQTDLSKKVALSWHNADDEVKLFCAEVSDILMHNYKKALYRQRKDSINSTEAEDSLPQSRVTKTRNVKKKTSRSKTLMPSQVVSTTTTEALVADPILSSITQSMIDTAPCTQQVMTRVLNEQLSAAAVISDSSVETTSWPSVGQLSLPLSLYHNNYASSQVDIDDNAIIDMWNAFDD